MSYIKGVGSVGERLRAKIKRQLPLDLVIGGLIVSGEGRKLTNIQIEKEVHSYLDEAEARESKTCIIYNAQSFSEFDLKPLA